jgi:hypothetical protein
LVIKIGWKVYIVVANVHLFNYVLCVCRVVKSKQQTTMRRFSGLFQRQSTNEVGGGGTTSTTTTNNNSEDANNNTTTKNISRRFSSFRRSSTAGATTTTNNTITTSNSNSLLLPTRTSNLQSRPSALASSAIKKSTDNNTIDSSPTTPTITFKTGNAESSSPNINNRGTLTTSNTSTRKLLVEQQIINNTSVNGMNETTSNEEYHVVLQANKRTPRNSYPFTHLERTQRIGYTSQVTIQKLNTKLTTGRATGLGLETFINNKFQATANNNTNNNDLPPLSKSFTNSKDIIKWKGLEHLDNRPSIWNSGLSAAAGADVVASTEEINYLQSLFKTTMKSEKSSTVVDVKKMGKIGGRSVLEPLRATAVTSAIKQLGVKPIKLHWALRDMNENYLTKEAIELMLAANLWPISKEELVALKTCVDNEVELAPADGLVYYIGTTVPDAQERVKALAFRHDFDTAILETIKGVMAITNAANEILTSRSLVKLLRACIFVGNQINQTVGGSQVKGVTLTTISKLAQTRSTVDRSLTALDFTVQFIAAKYPEVLDVMSELPTLGIARKHSFSGLEQQLLELKLGLERIRKFQQLDKFILEAFRKIQNVEHSIKGAKILMEKVLGYFGVEKSSTTTTTTTTNATGTEKMDGNDFFTILFTFLETFNGSIKQQVLRLQQQQQQPQQQQHHSTNNSMMASTFINATATTTNSKTTNAANNNSKPPPRKSIFGKFGAGPKKGGG